MTLDDLIVLDTETSGLEEPIGVCEIGMIELDPATLSEVGRLRSLIDPETKISFGAMGVHRITNEMVADQPTLDEYFDQVLGGHYANRDILMVCHNSSFDFPKVKHKFGPGSKHLCTLKLIKKLLPDAENHKLATLKFMLGLGRMDGTSHSALDDVEDTADLLRWIVRESGLSLAELYDLQHQPTVIKTMPFSKHKGQPLEDVPLSFWVWLSKQTGEGVDRDLAYSVNLLYPHIKLKEKPSV
jgi:exodeoxyribonuclease X